MKKLKLYLLFLMLLPLQSQAMLEEFKKWWKNFNGPSVETYTQFILLNNQGSRLADFTLF